MSIQQKYAISGGTSILPEILLITEQLKLLIDFICFFCSLLLLTLNLFPFSFVSWGTRWRSLLRHCATSQKVVGSIPDGLIGIFH
jgi:hypothetical protein